MNKIHFLIVDGFSFHPYNNDLILTGYKKNSKLIVYYRCVFLFKINYNYVISYMEPIKLNLNDQL